MTAAARQTGIWLALAAGLMTVSGCAKMKLPGSTDASPQPVHALIFFPPGRASLVPSADPVLDKVLAGLSGCPACKVSLIAFACKGESSTGPTRLAAQRAVAVSDHLNAHGIDNSRIILAVAGADYGPSALQTIGGEAPMCRTFVDARVGTQQTP